MAPTSPGQDPGTPDPAPGTGPAGLIWTRPPAEKRERPAREAIVAAATGLADTHGLDAVSVRRVAAALQTRPMDLYRYFARKDELIDLMFPSSSRMRGSYPGTATPVVPGRTAPGRLDRKMCSISVMPMPSRTSTPKCNAHRWYNARSAGPARVSLQVIWEEKAISQSAGFPGDPQGLQEEHGALSAIGRSPHLVMGHVRGLAGRFPGFQSAGAAASSASSSSSADAWSSSARSRRKSVAVPRRRPGRRGGSLHMIRCPGQVQGPPAGGSHRHLLCLLQLPVDRRPRHPEQLGQLGRVLLALRSSWSRCARCRGLSLGRLPFSLPRWRARAMPTIVRSRMMSTSNSAKAARMLKNTLPNGSLGS
jgi:hypothetical protein